MEGNDSLLREAARLLGSPQDRSAALVSLWEEAAHAMSAERFETALGFASCLATYESYHPRPDGVVRTRVEALERLSRFADAAAAAQSGVEHVAGRGARFELLRAQAHALGMAGRTDEALRSLRKAEGESAGRRAAWSALFTRGLVLRAAGRFEEARRCFERAAAHTSWYEGRDHALFHAAMLDAVAGTWPRAKRLVSQMRWLTSEHAFAAPACLSLMRGEHDKAFEQLERAVRSFDTTAFWPGARLAAAVLGETCGDMDRARRLFHEVVQTAPPESPAREVARFHLDRIDRVRLDCALGGLAASGGVFLRPLFTYLEGLSLEVKERPSEAAAYYARAVREDPTRYWPSVLAERRLRSLG
jgi:tetratricopeptide (TPR) repeat protein